MGGYERGTEWEVSLGYYGDVEVRCGWGECVLVVGWC